MSVKVQTVEERKAEVLIKLRKYKLLEKEKYEGAIGYIINIPQDKEKAMIWCILAEATVGIAAMNLLYKVMKEKELEQKMDHSQNSEDLSLILDEANRCKNIGLAG